jgi:hypothetical protein
MVPAGERTTSPVLRFAWFVPAGRWADAAGRLDRGGRIVGPDLDVLLHVLHGCRQVIAATESILVAAGALVWLPRRSQRAILAGQRRPGLSITTASGAGHDR